MRRRARPAKTRPPAPKLDSRRAEEEAPLRVEGGYHEATDPLVGGLGRHPARRRSGRRGRRLGAAGEELYGQGGEAFLRPRLSLWGLLPSRQPEERRERT